MYLHNKYVFTKDVFKYIMSITPGIEVSFFDCQSINFYVKHKELRVTFLEVSNRSLFEWSLTRVGVQFLMRIVVIRKKSYGKIHTEKYQFLRGH